MDAESNRPLTEAERRLAMWMLENGGPEALELLPQLADAEVTPWRCPCGCASFNFRVKGRPQAPPGIHVLADFVFFDGSDIAGIFIFSGSGILGGLEVTGMAGDPPKKLPDPAALMTHEAYGRDVLSNR